MPLRVDENSFHPLVNMYLEFGSCGNKSSRWGTAMVPEYVRMKEGSVSCCHHAFAK